MASDTDEEPTDELAQLSRGGVLRIDDPPIGEVSVLVPEPTRTAAVGPDTSQFVFAHPSGRVIGFNCPDVSDSDDWAACILIADEDGFQHAILRRPTGERTLYTRRQPGQPDDWEARGPITDLDVVDLNAAEDPMVGG